PGPGGYGPPGAPPGPGGYGPPGAPPGPGGYGPPGAPPGYGPAQPGYGGYPPGGPPAKKSKALLWVGIGCGGLLVLGIAGGIASYFYVKSQVSDAESAIAAAASAGALGTPAAPGTISATCAKAVACCKVVMTKNNANNAIATSVCNAIGLQSEAVCVTTYDAYKRNAAVSGATCP
ncbi:MAG: hypothetical protein ABW061_20025, partial [Polyangiaceae bacterium]